MERFYVEAPSPATETEPNGYPFFSVIDRGNFYRKNFPMATIYRGIKCAEKFAHEICAELNRETLS